ncbi:MAG: hypothetical protein PVJ92_03435 [Candidatus Dependentiae bacterium]|jgi:DNA polymerase III delta prime subunit
MKALPPCQISIGPFDQLYDHIVSYLQLQLCPTRQEDDTTPCLCATCQQVVDQQHHAITWLAPSKEYVLADLDQLFATVRFSLAPGERHFFVLQKAHLLSLACANKLLKILEEPPNGYHFLLLTNNKDALLPTIQSRCTILYEAASAADDQSKLLSFYLEPKNYGDPVGFEQALKAAGPTLSEAREIIWQVTHRVKGHEKAQRIMPQQGGHLYALKWLYMQMGIR